MSLLCVLMCLAGGCPRETQSRKADEKRGFIAVVGADRHDPHWPALQAAARANWVGRNVRVEAPAERSATVQGTLIRNLRDQGMRGLAVEVADSEALTGLLEQLRTSGVPVVTMLRPVPSSSEFPFCGIDPDGLSRSLAAASFERVAEGDTIGMLSDRSSPWLRRIRSGLLDQIATRPSLTVLQDLDCGGEPDPCFDLLSSAVEKYPGIDCWISLGDWPYRSNAPYWTLPPLIVPGPIPKYRRHFEEGRCLAMVVPDYTAIVRRAVEMCDLQIEKEVLQVATFYATAKIITSTTLDEFDRDWKALGTDGDAAE